MKIDPMRAARLRALNLDYPYFARGLCLLKFVPVKDHGTFSIDQHCRVYYDPELLKIWDVKETASVLVHELGHWLRKHFERAEALPHDERVEFHEHINACQDAEINDDLPGLPTKPFECVCPESLGCEAHRTWEEYYAATKSRARHRYPMRCGSGAHGVPCPWELGAPRAGEGLPNPLTAEAVRREVARDILRSKGAGGEQPSAGWLSWAEELLGPPQIPWGQQLQGVLHRGLARKAGQLDYSYQRRSRRNGRGIVLPGMVRPILRVIVVIDTSGSMDEEQRTAAVREVLGITRAVAEVTVICTDSHVRLVRRVSSARDIQLMGGGGTDMGEGLAAAAKQPADVTIVMTDGFTPWPVERHPRELIVVLVGEAAAPLHTVPSYAKVVRCPSETNKKSAAVAS